MGISAQPARAGRSKRWLLAGAAVVGAALIAQPASAATPPFVYGGLNWVVDRYTADDYTFPVSIHGRNDVLQMDIGPNGYAQNRPGGLQGQFYSTQGIKAATGLPGGEAFASVDLYIPAAWNFNASSVQDGSHVNNFYGDFTTVGLWGELRNGVNATTGFPIIRFRNAGEVAGNYIYGYNDQLGTNLPSAGGAINWDGWNTLRIEYRGDRYDYYLNGVLVATQSLVDGSGQTLVDDPDNSLAWIFFNTTTNNVSPESFYWSALKYGLIAIPGENQNLTADLNGSVEAENMGVMNIAPGVTVSGTALVESGGKIEGGSVANPYVINGATTVQAGGTLGGNGTHLGGIVSAGNIAPGNSPGIITTASYNALPGATATMEVDLSAAVPVNGVTHDLFQVTGNSTGAVTLVTISQLNAPNTGIPTTGFGFELIEVGGTVSPTAFQLAAPVFSGAYQYFLNYIPNFSGSLDGFFLQTGIREELWGHAALLSAGRTMLSACFRGDDRTGDVVRDGESGRAWAKYAGGNRKTGADSGIELDQDYSCASGGVDFVAGADIRLGISGGFGDSDVDVTTPAGLGTLQGDQSVVEGYAAYLRDRVFMNLSVGYASTDWTFDGPTFGPLSATADGLIGSLQLGMRWQSNNWRFGVAGEINYDGTECGDNCLVAGSVESASAWTAGVSVRVEGLLSGGNIIPFVALSYLDDLDGGNSVTLGTASIKTDTASSLFGARAGVTAYVSERVALFANVGITEGLDTDVEGVDGQGGIKVRW